MTIAGRARDLKKKLAPTSGAGYTCGSQASSGRIWNGDGSSGNANATWVYGSDRWMRKEAKRNQWAVYSW